MYVCTYVRTYLLASVAGPYKLRDVGEADSPPRQRSPRRGARRRGKSCRGQCSPHVGVCCCCCSRTLLLVSKRWNGPPSHIPWHPPPPNTAAGFSTSISTSTAFGSGQAREATAARRLMPFSSDRLRPQQRRRRWGAARAGWRR